MEQFKNVFFTISLLLCSMVSMGATFVWAPPSGTNNNWTVAGNWTVGGVYQTTATPGSTDDVSISYTTTQTINLPTTIAINSLSVTTNAANVNLSFESTAAVTFTIATTATITGPTTNAGVITSSFPIAVNATGKITVSNTKINIALTTVSNNADFTNTLFSSTVSATFNGAAASSCGGNTFNGKATLIHSGSGIVSFGVTNPDIFNSEVEINQSGTAEIRMASASTGNTFKEKIKLKVSLSAINFCNNTNSSATLSDAAYFSAIGTENTNGAIILRRITKTSTDVSSIVMNGGSITVGPSLSTVGDFDITAPFISQLSNAAADVAGTGGCNVFDGNVSFTKTGEGDNQLYGGSLFKKNVRYTNSCPIVGSNSAGATLLAATYSKDIVLGNLIAENISANRNVYICSNIRVEGNLIISNTSNGLLNVGSTSGGGLSLSGTSSIVAGSYGLTGNTVGFLNLIQDQSGVHPDINLDMSGVVFKMFDGIALYSNFFVKANFISFQGGSFYGTTSFEQVGSTSNAISYSTGNILFDKDVTFINGGTGAFNIGVIDGQTITANATVTVQTRNASGNITLVNRGSMTINGDLILKHLGGAQHIYLVSSTTSNLDVYGNIVMTKTATGTGQIYIGNSNVVKQYGTTTTVSIGAEGFLDGAIQFKNFQQIGAHPDIVMDIPTGTTSVYFFNPAVFNSKLNINVASIFLKGGEFNEDVVLVKNGSASNQPSTTLISTLDFKKNFTLTNNGTGYIYVGTHVSDVCTVLGNTVFNKNATAGNIGFVRYGTANLQGNLTLNFATATNLAMGSAGGLLVFNGSTNQYVNCNIANNLMNQLKIDKSAGDVIVQTGNIYLQKNAAISSSITFVKGRIITQDPSLSVTIDNTGFVTGANILSFVSGKVRKVGADAFTFPVGKDNFYAPISITAPANTSTNVYAEYFHTAHSSTYTATLPGSMPDISNIAYWSLTCPNTYSSSIAVTLFWNETNYEPINKSTMTVARYASNAWNDAGGTSTGTNTSGTVVATSTTSFVGDYALGYKSAMIINLLNVYPAKYKTSGTYIDFFRNVSTYPYVDFISTSGASPVLPNTYTKLAYQNPQKMVVHPTINSTCAQIDIMSDAADVTYSPMSICLSTDGNGYMTFIKTGGNDISSDYYTYSSSTKELVLYPNKKPDGATKIANNLNSGSIWKKTSNPTLTFTVGGNVFAYADLKVKSVATGAYLPMGTVTYVGGVLSWTGASITADGLYVYELSLGSTANGTGASVYTGNMLVKTTE